MAVNTVEAKIRSYSNDQLTGVSQRVERQLIKVALGVDTHDALFSAMRVISGMLEQNGFPGFTVSKATSEDIATVERTMMELGRFSRLLSLKGKLSSETLRRQVYERLDGS